jgi:8-oxo-dGTP pyrophosphatase MutT (NUDIX family)
MPAPAEFAQIIVIGLEAEAWLLLYLLAFGTWRWPADVPEGILLFVVTAASIILGVLFDRIADSAYTAFRQWSPVLRLLRPLNIGENTPKGMIARMRLRLNESDSPRSRFLEYQRTRFRIARATTFNLFMMVPAVGLFLGLRTHVGAGPIVLAVLLIALGAGLSFYTAERIGTAWVRILSEAYRHWARENPAKAAEDLVPSHGASLRSVNPKCFRVGAVCFREEKHGLPEFLLVRTSDGRFWTIPKGHVERGEPHHKAASREAEEEAGVVGEVSRSPFTVYRYPTAGGPCEEVVVDAYLLQFERMGDPKKSEHRELRWAEEGEAKRLLTSGRTVFYGLEHIRLIDEAQREIAARRGPGRLGQWLQRLRARRGGSGPTTP